VIYRHGGHGGNGGRGHVNNHDDSNRRRRRATATEDTAYTASMSRHMDNTLDSEKAIMNPLRAMDVITVADTMTTETATAGMTTTSGFSGINVAPTTAIPTSIVARP